MDPKAIAQEAISKLNKEITNNIFLIIQNDRDLMQKYLHTVQELGLDQVNTTIGKEVKAAYNLKNIDDREDNPSCTLIQSHQKFEYSRIFTSEIRLLFPSAHTVFLMSDIEGLSSKF